MSNPTTIPAGFEQSAAVRSNGVSYVARRAIGSSDFWIAIEDSEFDALPDHVEIDDAEFVFAEA